MKKKILLAVILIILLGGAAMAAQTAVQVMQVKSLIKKIQDIRGNVIVAGPIPTTLEMTDKELNAGIDLMCNTNQMISLGKRIGLVSEKNLPIAYSDAFIPCQFFNNFDIKFEEGRYSATARLLKPTKGEISVKGNIVIVGERNIKVAFQEVNLDGKPASAETVSLLENTANQEMNSILDKMQHLSIDSAVVSPGKITIKGTFSFDEFLCVLGVTNYCPPPTSPIIY